MGELLAAVTSGPLPDGALAALDGVARHSPLGPWKLLIRALDAYYRRADGAVLANLDAIPPQAAPARLVPVLRHLVGERATLDSRPPAVGALVQAVTGGRALLRSSLQQLVRALEARDAQAALTAVERIIPLLASDASLKRTFAVTVLLHWRRLNLHPRPLINALLRDRRDHAWQRDAQRLIALALERAGVWDQALFLWDAYLTAASRSGSLSERARAAILRHMAELFPSDRDEVLDTFGVDSEDALRAAIDDGELPECADRGRLLAQARDLDPDSRVYRALVAHWEALDPRRAEAEAESWRRINPRDIEPLLHLARAAERRGAHRRALEVLDEAEAINGVHPEVRQSRFRLLLGSAERRIRDGRISHALADLDRLEKEPGATGGDTLAYLAALRIAATRRSGEGATAVRLQEELAARLGNPTLLALILASVAESFSLEPPDPPAPASQAAAVQALARACDLFRALGRGLAVPPALLTRVERDLTGASPADLHSLAEGGLAMGRPALTYVASGQGLAGDGPLLHRFLLLRGRALALAATSRDRGRARRCLRVARELGGRARDMDAVREASAALEALARAPGLGPFGPGEPFEDESPPTREDIALLVAVERDLREPPRFSSATKERRKPRPSRRKQRDLFDDFLAFLEKSL